MVVYIGFDTSATFDGDLFEGTVKNKEMPTGKRFEWLTWLKCEFDGFLSTSVL